MRIFTAGWLVCCLLIALGIGFTRASAQSAPAPRKAVFDASPDHDVVAHGQSVVQLYELVVTKLGTSTPLPAQPLGKPAPVNGVITVVIEPYLLSLPSGDYTAVVRAVGPGGTGTSNVSAPFPLVVPAPAMQGTPQVIR